MEQWIDFLEKKLNSYTYNKCKFPKALQHRKQVMFNYAYFYTLYIFGLDCGMRTTTTIKAFRFLLTNQNFTKRFIHSVTRKIGASPRKADELFSKSIRVYDLVFRRNYRLLPKLLICTCMKIQTAWMVSLA